MTNEISDSHRCGKPLCRINILCSRQCASRSHREILIANRPEKRKEKNTQAQAQRRTIGLTM